MLFFSCFIFIICRCNKIATIEVSPQSLGSMSLISPQPISSRYVNLEYSFHQKQPIRLRQTTTTSIVLVCNQISGDWDGHGKSWTINGRDLSSRINSNRRPKALKKLQQLVTYRDLRLQTYVHTRYLTLFFGDPFSGDSVPAETDNSKTST